MKRNRRNAPNLFSPYLTAADGAMSGTNRALYARLAQSFSGDLIASGGVSTLSDIAALKELGLSGAIVGKAYYSGAINLKEALEVGR